MQTLAWLRANTFRPVALAHRSKAALSRSYVEAGYSAPPDSFWQGQQLGIGVVTGPRNSGPIDIDLDCPEAVFFAPRFLPPTAAVFGRKSKPRSHYLYRVSESVTNVEKTALLDPTKPQTIIELRADGGHQTVMPGSLHQDTGEPIEWATLPFPSVAVVEPGPLLEAVRRVALATIVARYCWPDGGRNVTNLHLAGMFYYLEWPLDETEKLIGAVMDYWEDTDKTRMMTIRSTYKKAQSGAKVTGAKSLRKIINNDPVVDRILDLAGSPSINMLVEYNERYAVVNVEGKFRIADLDVDPSDLPVFYQKDDFINLTATDFSGLISATGKPVPKAALWLGNPRRRQYGSVGFEPGASETNFLNLWTGWAIQPSKGECSGWLELLKDVICGGDETLYTWMLHWFANIFREPTRKSLTAPVLIGRQGAGKSLLMNYIGAILGRGYTVVTNEEHVIGKFNRHLANTILLHSEEALYGGDKKHRSIIKSLITDEYRIFEQKGVDARQVRNHLRLVLTSNETHAAPVEANDRRFTVIDLADRVASPELIGRVVAESRGPGPAALHAHFLAMPYDPTIPRTNVKNDALGALKGVNLTGLDNWWYQVLIAGSLLPEYLSWAQRPHEEEWPELLSSAALYVAMHIKLKETGARAIPNETLFALQLNKMIGIQLKRAQRFYSNPQADGVPAMVKQLTDRQNTILNMPDLPTCRKAFEKYLGQPIDWPDEIPEAEKRPYQRKM